MGEASLEVEAAALKTPELRTLAYEMALAVCDADGVSSEKEKGFLEENSQMSPSIMALCNLLNISSEESEGEESSYS